MFHNIVTSSPSPLLGFSETTNDNHARPRTKLTSKSLVEKIQALLSRVELFISLERQPSSSITNISIGTYLQLIEPLLATSIIASEHRQVTFEVAKAILRLDIRMNIYPSQPMLYLWSATSCQPFLTTRSPSETTRLGALSRCLHQTSSIVTIPVSMKGTL